ncbi:MAG: phytanoyl-CoA dioxygenase family protein [Acidimicrobiales bacterium]
MPLALSNQQIEQYESQGWVSPLDVLTEAEAASARAKVEEFEAEYGAFGTRPERSRAYLPFTWVDEIMRNPLLVDMVEDLIGTDILCWNAIFWIKEPGAGSFVGWHQDATYWGLDNLELVSVWVALSEASEEAGCMSVLPGSHRQTFDHDETYDANNLLTRGQHINNIDPAATVAMPLRPGQASFHNIATAHGSGPNDSQDRRIGLSLHYMPTYTRQTRVDWDSAAFIRGEDRHHNFDHALRPTSDLDPDVMAYHERSADALRRVVYDGADTSRTTL